jgi:hypothetical protein
MKIGSLSIYRERRKFTLNVKPDDVRNGRDGVTNVTNCPELHKLHREIRGHDKCLTAITRDVTYGVSFAYDCVSLT